MQKAILPQNQYYDIDFDKIKKLLKQQQNIYNIKDYNSTTIFEYEDLTIDNTKLSVNDSGVLCILPDNNLSISEVEKIRRKIENIFKQVIDNFEFEEIIDYKKMFQLLCTERSMKEKGCCLCPCKDICPN